MTLLKAAAGAWPRALTKDLVLRLVGPTNFDKISKAALGKSASNTFALSSVRRLTSKSCCGFWVRQAGDWHVTETCWAVSVEWRLQTQAGAAVMMTWA